MRLIKVLGERPSRDGKGRLVARGLWYCPGCKEEVEMPMSIRNGTVCGRCRHAVLRGKTVYRPQPAERMCLMCGKKFMSRGPQNRRCPGCEIKVDGDGQAYYMPPVHKQRDHSVVAGCGET